MKKIQLNEILVCLMWVKQVAQYLYNTHICKRLSHSYSFIPSLSHEIHQTKYFWIFMNDLNRKFLQNTPVISRNENLLRPSRHP